MFGFAWVRTHLGVILSDALGVFKSFGLIFVKREEMIKNLGKIGGPSRRQRDPPPQRRASPRQGRVGRMAPPRVRYGGFATAKLLFIA